MFCSPEPEYMDLLVDMDYSSPSSFYTLGDSTRPSSTNTGPMPTTGSRHSLDSGYEEPSNFQQDIGDIDGSITTLSHVNSMASNFTSTDAGSPELQHDNASTAHLFRPPPMSNMLWPSAASNPLAETYGSSATMTGSEFQFPNFGAHMMPLLSHQGYQQGWPQETTSSYTLDSNMNAISLDLFLPPPAFQAARPANVYHPRAYSESTIPTASLMRRNPTSQSEGSISNSEDYPIITTTTPQGQTRRRARTNRRLTMSSINTPATPRVSTRRRASTRGASRPYTTPSGHNSSAGDRSRPTSGPSTPEITRTRGQHTHGAFTCPLSPYGCESTFTSKNEWKRHVVTKHLKLGYYECSLCPIDGMRAPYQNSRKDLFSQHIWRMHLQTSEPVPPRAPVRRSAPSTFSTNNNSHTRQASTSSGGQVTEAVIERYGDIYPDCYKAIRDAPQQAYCVFCGEYFRGDNSTENWLEHVGRQHFLTLQPGRRGGDTTGRNTITAAMPGFTHTEWLNDVVLQRWLVQYGEIVWDNATGSYVLAGDSNNATASTIAEEGPDAEGEPDLDFSYFD